MLSITLYKGLLTAVLLIFLIQLLINFRKVILTNFRLFIFHLTSKLNHITVKIIALLQRAERKLSKHLPREGDELFEELTPQDNVDTDKVYDKQLKWALENPNIRNIAITGPYGSGKSSILKTFQKFHHEYKFLNLSLASFAANEKPVPIPKAELNGETPVNTPVKNEVDGQLVEFSLLQQIILHIRHSKLPGSRFHRIRHQQRWYTALMTFCIALFAAAFLKVVFPEDFTKLRQQFSASTETELIIKVLPYFFLLGFLASTYLLLRIMSRISVSKIKITDTEVELTKKDLSVLNKHMEEILYFFEVTSYEVVVIEDLDRFGNPSIFTKLREINQLICNSEQVKHKVVFVYVLGDSMFRGEERTKFFDFIIPVIPVVNSSNSYQLLSDRIKKAGLSESLPDDFISDISLYITDMRLLKNIMNEFNLYYAKLKKEKERSLNDKYLFSMLVYKNKYPDDFAKLHQGEGMVAEVFRNKEALIRKNAEELTRTLDELEKKISASEDLVPQKIEELNLIYASKWLSLMKRQPAIGFLAGGNRYFLHDLAKTEIFDQLIRSMPEYYLYELQQNNIHSRQTEYSFKEAQDLIDPDHSYKLKHDLVLLKANNELDNLRQQIAHIKQKLLKQQYAPLSLLLNDTSGEILLKDLHEQRLLVYMLRNGYINEDYAYYISYFYEGSLLAFEHEFILSVKDRTPKPFTYALTNIPAILKKLQLKDFETPAILNLQLMDYLLIQPVTWKEGLDILFQTVLVENTNTMEAFTEQYLKNGKAVPLYVRTLARYRTDWWDVVHRSSAMTTEEKEQVYSMLIKHADVQDLVAMNQRLMNSYLSVFRNFQLHEEKLKKLFRNLGVQVVTVDGDTVIPDTLMQFIYENNMYAINPEMIRRIIAWKAGDQEILNWLDQMHYTVVQESGLENLISYVSGNISTYIEDVYLMLPDNTKDTESMVLDLLTHSAVEPEITRQVILKVDTKFTALKSFTNNYWNFLIENNKLTPNWKNILDYFEQFRVTQELVEFISRPENAAFLATEAAGTEPVVEELAQELILSNDLSNETLTVISPQFLKPLEGLPIDELPIDRLGALVSLDFIDFTEENLSKLQKRSRDLALEILLNNTDDLLQNPENYNLEPVDYLGLLTSKYWSDEQKTALILHISPDKFEYAPLATTVAGSIKDRITTLQFSTLLVVLQHSTDKAANLSIATRTVESLTEGVDKVGVVDQILSVLGDEFAEIQNRGKNPSLINNPNNKAFITTLAKLGYISSFKEEDELIRVYTKKPEKE